jgi:hypothetical protein
MTLEIRIKVVQVVRSKAVIVENELDARKHAASIVKRLREENPREEYWFEIEEIMLEGQD